MRYLLALLAVLALLTWAVADNLLAPMRTTVQHLQVRP